MPTHEIRRAYKRPAISDQQKRRELSLLRQQQSRVDAQSHARRLASTLFSFNEPTPSTSSAVDDDNAFDIDTEPEEQEDYPNAPQLENLKDVRQASKLRGQESRRWFARQLMLPEWMIDVPDRLSQDWFVLARPAGKRCFIVSTNGTTISRQRNGIVLHHFPSALPCGARTRGNSGSGQSYCILDCIFHEVDQTYYVIDMLCWGGYSLYDCNAEFRFFWLNSKLAESDACGPPSQYHRYRFSPVPVYSCDHSGLLSAYAGQVPYVKDGLLFYNKHAHYQPGNTPLTLVWKDEKCSQYVIDTDNKGEVPSKQQVVLELQNDGKVITSDDPPVVFGCLDQDFQQKSGLSPGNLLRFSMNDGGLTFVDGKFEKADLQFQDKPNRARAFADSYSKVVFQYMARRSPLKIDDLLGSINSRSDQENKDVEMSG
ncbi:snurportin-1-like isoform X1 [Chenopodium quinoa]|uniref:snurportin-1-like isoform X1 n=1 Tax=Chenopodium quinoa TaxID=63459 RepID=UPI000B780547|nr:snurportin-1-like isoform X1 [Chenopodium quinoa]